jgi:hypothetical protein
MGIVEVVKGLFVSAPQYKSTGEELVAKFLAEAGIPFWYEKELILFNGRYNERFLPDFTIRRKPKYIEYWGMIDHDVEYARRMRYKMAIFHRNNIDFLSVYPSELYREKYKKKIEKFVR